MLFSRIALCLTVTLAYTAHACTSDFDCSLNGECISSSGVCNCFPGWVGSTCAALNLRPANASQGMNMLPAGVSSWGGNAVEVDGKFHLYYAKMEGKGCTLNAWNSNSACWHAVGNSPQGPFTDVGVAVGVWCHGPSIHKAQDGTLVLWHIGKGNDDVARNCTKRSDNPSYFGHQGRIGYITFHTSTSPYGPWKPFGKQILPGRPGLWDSITTNPGPIHLYDGSVLLSYRGKIGSTERVGLASAPHYTGPYTRVQSNPISNHTGEDPCVVVNSGGVHVIFHDFAPTNGGHFFAKSASGPWTYASMPAYGKAVQWVNGSTTILTRRERPQFFFGNNGTPQVLYTGVVGSGESSTQASFTLAQLIGAQ
jgi:hypothetical protein